jgi:ribosome maturation factor RimP
MEYTGGERDKETEALTGDLEPLITGMGFALVELDLFRSKKLGTAQVRLVLTRPPGAEGGGIGTGDLSRIHRAVLPRLELALEGADFSVELSSPGTDRIIRNGAEFRHFTGRAVKCYRTDTSDWFSGVLRASDKEKILLETKEGIIELKYGIIAKAKLDNSGFELTRR